MKRIALTIAAVLLLAPAFPLDAALALGTLAGHVVDKNGTPVADAAVFVETSDGEHPHVTRSDKSGQFEFDRYSAGQYDLRASYDSVFSEWAKRVLVRAGKKTEVTLRIPASVK